LNILIVNYEYPPIGGGGGFVTRDIAEHIIEMGHGVTVLTSHFKGLPEEEILNGVHIRRVPVIDREKLEVASLPSMLSYFPSSLLQVFIKMDADCFDVINTHFAIPSGPTGYVLSKIFTKPNILSIHGGDIYDPSKKLSPHNTPVLYGTVRFMLNSSNIIVAQSSDTKANAINYYHCNRPIRIIPLGIKKPVYKKASRQDFAIPEDAIVISTIGRLVRRKNIDDALHVLSKLKNKSILLLIMGDGPQRHHLAQKVSTLKLDTQVRFMGNVTDEEKFQLLSLSDFFLSTAMHEGFGLIFLEAMECGLPIISYDKGGQIDFLANGKTGYLVSLGDRQSLGEAIERLLSSPPQMNEMSAFNKRLVEKFYIEKCAEKYVNLFKTAIAKHKK
jgi:glycosyltransferase involved in cell wall biosynthesis